MVQSGNSKARGSDAQASRAALCGWHELAPHCSSFRLDRGTAQFLCFDLSYSPPAVLAGNQVIFQGHGFIFNPIVIFMSFHA